MYHKLDVRDVTEPRTPMVGSGARTGHSQAPMLGAETTFDETAQSPMLGGLGQPV
jgi:hypothetical protein